MIVLSWSFTEQVTFTLALALIFDLHYMGIAFD